MAEPFKNIYNEPFFNEFTNALKCIINDFDERLFLSQIFDNEWENRGIKQRMRHTTTILKNFLPTDYKTAITKILELVNHLKETPYGLALKQKKDTQ